METTIVRFVGGPLDGELHELEGEWTPGSIYSAPYMPRPFGEARTLRYELRADRSGPADLVGVPWRKRRRPFPRST